jgi:hypothetical protein
LSGIRRVRLVGCGAAIGVMALLSSFPATDASISYNGSDYTEVAGSSSYATTCDKEADSHRVRGELDTDNSAGGLIARVYDNDGANSVCGDLFWDETVRRHRTCERGTLTGWGCGNWKSHP